MSNTAYQIIETETLPSKVGAFEFHFSRRFEMAAVACACGCGHRVMLNLRDQHRLVIEGVLPTVTPSILVSDAPCLSHFYIRQGKVQWANPLSKKAVHRIMNSQLRRHVELDQRRQSKRSRLRRWLSSLFKG